MASVLLCDDERLGRRVAVKRLHAASPDEMEQRFAREARLGASLNHPNLVAIYDTATDDEGVLIVMEYVEGESLAKALRRGPLEPERVAAMASELGAALDHAHAHGVVHRDVKPANVLLRKDGVAKLADLGIATAADLTRITRSGIVLGTAVYMAPEQLDGGKAGPAADVYALAAVCFEALTGRQGSLRAHAYGDRERDRHRAPARPARPPARGAGAGRRHPPARPRARAGGTAGLGRGARLRAHGVRSSGRRAPAPLGTRPIAAPPRPGAPPPRRAGGARAAAVARGRRRGAIVDGWGQGSPPQGGLLRRRSER